MLSIETQWQLVQALVVAVPVSLAVLVMLAKLPRSAWLRGSLGIVLAWVASVALTIWCYNPVGYAYTVARLGEEYAFNRFDNNTIASTMLGGWILPLMTVIVFVGSQMLWRRLARKRKPQIE